MRVRDHIALSTAGAAALAPWAGRRALGAWAASILIDIDHYLWFSVHERQVSPRRAVRFFNQPDAPHHPATRVLHHPTTLLAVALLGTRRRGALPVALGMAFHVALDVQHERRLRDMRTTALRRDDFTCQACGVPGRPVTSHVWRQPRLLPSYRMQDVVTLCTSCHEAAHANA